MCDRATAAALASARGRAVRIASLPERLTSAIAIAIPAKQAVYIIGGEDKQLVGVVDLRDLVLAAGGDGTINEVANGIIGTESIMAVMMPVTVFVAPGPEVARATPTLPVP